MTDADAEQNVRKTYSTTYFPRIVPHRSRSKCVLMASSSARPDSACGTAYLLAVVGVECVAGMPATDPVRVAAARVALQGSTPLCECAAQAMETLGRGQATAEGMIETRVTTANK